MQQAHAVDPDAIAPTERLIRPYIRRTPVIEIDASDFGLSPFRLACKPEFMQHAGVFKTRGAFANLLMREVPKPGVVAARERLAWSWSSKPPISTPCWSRSAAAD